MDREKSVFMGVGGFNLAAGKPEPVQGGPHPAGRGMVNCG